MATYYISTVIDSENVIFAMNSTSEIKLTTSGELSEHKLESGDISSDNYVNKPDVVSMSGVISDVFVGNSISDADKKTTKEYIEGLKKLKDTRKPFTLHYASDLTPLTPCFFKSLTITQSTKNGFVGVNSEGKSINSYSVSMVVAVTRIGQLATFTAERSTAFVDSTQPKVESSASTKGVEDGEDNPFLSGIRTAGNGIDNFGTIASGGQ